MQPTPKRGFDGMNYALYQRIAALIPTLHGWCDVPKAITLANLVLALKPRRALEIGVWGGRSALPMAMALKELAVGPKQLDSGVLICVDPWCAEASIEGQTTPEDTQWWGSAQNHEFVYHDFLGNVKKFGLEDFVDVRRERSRDATVTGQIQIAHIDGLHGPDAHTDIVKFAPLIEPGGVCVLDDLTWTGGHVLRAAEWLKANGFIELHHLGTGAAYLRV